MISRKASSRALVAVVGLSLVACAANHGSLTAFSLSAAPSSETEVTALVERVRHAPRAVETAVVVLTPPEPAQGFTIVDPSTGQRRGQVGARLDSRAIVAADSVIALSDGAVVAWDLDGHERWRISAGGLPLNAAGSDGSTLAVTLGGQGVTRRRGVLLIVDARTGSLRSRQSVDHALGVPAVAGDDVLVPWDGQNLSDFDASRGTELARIRTRDDIVGWAFREGPTVWFGSRALYRLDAHASSGRNASMTRWSAHRTDLPGGATFAPDGYNSFRHGLDARERVRTVWRVDGDSPDGSVRFVSDALYALFHQVLFALSPDTGAVRWALRLPNDVVGAAVVRHGLVTVDTHGVMRLSSALDGRALSSVAFDQPSVQASVQLPVEFSPTASSSSETVPPLHQVLFDIAAGTDARLLPAQIFAAKTLGTLDGAEATHALVSLLSRRALAPELRAAAGEALATRTQGTDAMLEALGQHYDYVHDIAAPPVGILARALAAARDRRAVPLLVAQLFDPATSVADLAPIIVSLQQLGDPLALGPLVEFLQLYHADVGGVPSSEGGDPIDDRELGNQQHLDAAMTAAIGAIARLGGPDELQLLDTIAEHPLTPSTVASAARAARSSPQQNSNPDAGTNSEASSMTFTLPPNRLDAAAIESAAEPQRASMLECLRGARSRPAQLRIQFRYDNEGHISHVSVIPREFQDCVTPRFEAVQLPTSGSAMELGTYLLDTRR